MTRKFMLDPTSAGDNDVVADSTYTVEVVDARALEDKDFIWLDLRILGGPDDGRTVSVSLNMPDDSSSRGAKFYFEKKVRGFLPVVGHVWALPDEQQPSALADAMRGQKVSAALSIQKEGQYKGSQQLDATEQLVDVAPAVRAVPPVETQGTSVDIGTQTTINTSANPEPLDPPF